MEAFLDLDDFAEAQIHALLAVAAQGVARRNSRVDDCRIRQTEGQWTPISSDRGDVETPRERVCNVRYKVMPAIRIIGPSSILRFSGFVAAVPVICVPLFGRSFRQSIRCAHREAVPSKVQARQQGRCTDPADVFENEIAENRASFS